MTVLVVAPRLLAKVLLREPRSEGAETPPRGTPSFDRCLSCLHSRVAAVTFSSYVLRGMEQSWTTSILRSRSSRKHSWATVSQLSTSETTAEQSLRRTALVSIRRGGKYSSSIAALFARVVVEADRDYMALVMPSLSDAKWLSSPRGGAPCNASKAAAVLGRLTIGALLRKRPLRRRAVSATDPSRPRRLAAPRRRPPR